MSANQSPERFHSATKLVNHCDECLADDTRPCICITFDQTAKQDLVSRLLAGRVKASRRKAARAERLAYARTFKKPFLRKQCAVRLNTFFNGCYNTEQEISAELAAQAADAIARSVITPERLCEVCLEQVSSHLTDCPVINQPYMLCWEFCSRRLFCTDRNRCDMEAAQKYMIAKGFVTAV